MSPITRRSALSLVTGASGALAAPGVFGQARASNIVMVTGVDPSFAPLVMAMKKGFFEKYGVNADFRIFDDGSVALDSLLTGEGDVGSTVEMGGIARRVKGGQLFVTAHANYTDQFFGLVGSDTIKTAADLPGKTVSLSIRGGPAHLFLTRYMRHYNLDISQLKIKFVGAPESVAALAGGNVDVVCGGEPWLGRAVAATPGTHYIMKQTRGGEAIYRLTDYFYFGKRLMDNPEVAQNTMRALIEGSEWVPNNREESIRTCAEVYKVSNEVSAAIIDLFSYEVDFSPSVLASFTEAADFQKALGVIDRLPDFTAFLNPAVLQAVAPNRVKAA